MVQKIAEEMLEGIKTAYFDNMSASNPTYRPQFVSNNYKAGRKVLSVIEDELLGCEQFQISVAFITMSGIAPLLQTFKQLEAKGVSGKILTTNYLNFSEPEALKKLNEYDNIALKMFDVSEADTGFHTKGYIFRKDEIYRIIIGSSNITSAALTRNLEWNTRILSTEQGEMAREIANEFDELWNSEFSLDFDGFYEDYRERYNIIKHQREMARRDEIPSIEKYRLQPNLMQVKFISNLKKILESGENRALLISATGTGKTFASAFAMRELGFKKILFLVHRGQLARQTMRSYKRIFDESVSMGLVGAGYHQYDSDYVFATIQTLNREDHLVKYEKEHFDCIILDEAHHSAAGSYQKVMSYFKPKLWLGMTATPDRRDDDADGKNIYEIFNYQIAYEIRLQQAMEENLLCPFHYFGISDISLVEEKELKKRQLTSADFSRLTGNERVQHIIDMAEYYGYSGGDRVKGLVFCSRIDESEELSKKFNKAGYRTIALNGNATEEERQNAFDRLAMGEQKRSEFSEPEENSVEPLDYIFSVEILNEGVDIVEVNQVIMLRPTESPIVFIQQLGRGLRKAAGKEYVVVLDFIGNYNNNFMIPIALSGDRTYNPDNIRKYVISGNNIIPGASTVHFDEIAKDKIFSSIDKIRGIKSIIRASYKSLKDRLGRVPYLLDFYDNGEIDPLVIIREYKTYHAFLQSVEKDYYSEKLSEGEEVILEYLSKTVLNGTRVYELEILRELMEVEFVSEHQLEEEFTKRYGYSIDITSLKDAIGVLQGNFVSQSTELKKYSQVDILECDEMLTIKRMGTYSTSLGHDEFRRQLNDIVFVGLKRYSEKYAEGYKKGTPFVMYEKYSRRDVSLLMNCGKDLSSTMYGMQKIGDDVFIFVNYHKEESTDSEKIYIDGKPDYADAFEDNIIFNWDSQIGRNIDSSYVKDVIETKNKHLLVKKSSKETNFYYMGTFDVIDVVAAKKKDNKGRERDITKFKMKMHNAVREDLLRYLQSSIKETMQKENEE